MGDKIMETKIMELLGLVFKLALRHWSKDNTDLNDSVLDIQQFALQQGLSIWQAKKFDRTINDFIDIVSEDFMKEVGTNNLNNERKKAIVDQINTDLKQITFNEKQIINNLSDLDALRDAIIEQSKEERKTWNSIENGVYINAVRYITKVCVDFVVKLPNFTSEALKIIIQRQGEYYNILHNVLEEIHSMTALIKSADVKYREYESIYREKIVEKYSKVELFGSGVKERYIRRYDISSAYVELNCIDGDEYSDEIELSDVFTYKNVVWIKGEAGCGKTTFLRWVAVCAAKNEYEKIRNIRNTMPIVISLRNVVWPLNLQNIVNNVTAPYGNNCPDGWINELIKSKRVILLFDGFDEISQKRREDTYSFVVDLVEKNSDIKVLMTARNSVNDLLEFDSAYFEIMPMKIDNIKKFITYWHDAVLRKDAIIPDQEIGKLCQKLICKIIESKALKSLAKNPLLCAMICALNFTNDEYLPDDKMQLYEKCCEMLMDARDNQREISSSIYENVPKLDYVKKRRIFEELSYWMMNGGVSSEYKCNVVEFLRHLMKDTNIFSDNNEKSYNPENILDYLIERSGIIREPEDGVIDFVHKTFMEFLAVKAVCRNCAWNVLVKEACNENWMETITMCFKEMGKENVEQILKKLLEEGKKKHDDRYILLASIGMSNSLYLPNKAIKEEIDNKIRSMIPPKENDVYRISQAGIYLLPFLRDSVLYSDSERIRCLNVLEHMDFEEAIPYILSYVTGKGNDNVKFYALSILSEYYVESIEEYNVEEQLIDYLKQSIENHSLSVHEAMLAMISCKNLGEEEIEAIGNVTTLEIMCGLPEDRFYIENLEILKYFENCTTVSLYGEISNLTMLKVFQKVEKLIIRSDDDLSDAIIDFEELCNLGSVKYLEISAPQIKYFCEQDIKHLLNLETFKFSCLGHDLELDLNSFERFSKLKHISVLVNLDLENEIRSLKSALMQRQGAIDIEISCIEI